MREAQAVLEERDAMLSDAKAEAERTIGLAQTHALEMVQEQGLYKTAEREARRIIEEANQQARETRARADEYAMHSLLALETQLANTLHTVQNGIAALRDTAPMAE
jgi:vacuolar-type H+-ATPase subunit H